MRERLPQSESRAGTRKSRPRGVEGDRSSHGRRGIRLDKRRRRRLRTRRHCRGRAARGPGPRRRARTGHRQRVLRRAAVRGDSDCRRHRQCRVGYPRGRQFEVSGPRNLNLKPVRVRLGRRAPAAGNGRRAPIVRLPRPGRRPAGRGCASAPGASLAGLRPRPWSGRGHAAAAEADGWPPGPGVADIDIVLSIHTRISV